MPFSPPVLALSADMMQCAIADDEFMGPPPCDTKTSKQAHTNYTHPQLLQHASVLIPPPRFHRLCFRGGFTVLLCFISTDAGGM